MTMPYTASEQRYDEMKYVRSGKSESDCRKLRWVYGRTLVATVHWIFRKR